jgi:hypothetical protein
MLFDLRHDPESCRFVDAPVSAMASGMISTRTATVPPMKAIAGLYRLINCPARDGPENAANAVILRSWEAVDMLEFVELAGERRRSRITRLLSGWLTEAN